MIKEQNDKRKVAMSENKEKAQDTTTFFTLSLDD